MDHNQLARLIDRLASDEDKKKLVALLETFEVGLTKQAPVSGTQDAVIKRYKAMLGTDLKQLIKLGLTAPEFQRIASRLPVLNS